MNIDLVTFEEYKRLHGEMDQETFDKVVAATWTQEQYDASKDEIKTELSDCIDKPTPEQVGIYTKISNVNTDKDSFWKIIETNLLAYLLQGKSEDYISQKYSFATTLPIRRKESSLIYGAPPKIMELLVSGIADTFNIPVIEFEDLMEAHEEGSLRGKLNEYRGGELIIKNAYDSTDKYTSDQTVKVYRVMTGYTQDPNSPTQFYMFSDPTNPGLEQRANDASHPMFNWNTFVDLSNV